MAEIVVRPGARRDIAPLDALFARAYPKLLAPDYPPSVLVTAIPLISRAQPRLVTSGTYQVALIGDRLVGAGGWTRVGPGGRGARQSGVGHVRHFVTDPDHTRQGIARAVMTRVLQDAARSGVRELLCMSTRTAVPFYESMGFTALGPVVIALAPGIDFPAQKMARRLS